MQSVLSKLTTSLIVLIPLVSESVLAHEGHPDPEWYEPYLRWLEKYQDPILSFFVPIVLLIVIGVVISKIQDKAD